MPDAAESLPPSPLERALQRYLRHVAIERGLSPNTTAAYRRDVSAYLGVLAARGVEQPASIDRDDVAAFARALAEREGGALAASSVARILSSVRGFHRFLLDEGLTTVDAAADVTVPKLPRRLPKALPLHEVEALLDAVGGEDPLDVRDRALLELLYATGARVSEAVALNVDDIVGDDDGTAEVVRLFGKGSKQRLVPLGSFARRALETYLVRVRPELSARGRATPALFLGARGARLSRQSAWLVIRSAAERAGMTAEVSPHTLRHSFATHLLSGGADVRVVQELLGHASVATTQLYTLVTADALRDVYLSSHPRAR